MYAASEGHTDIVRALIDAGVDVNAKDNYGPTALEVAALNGHTDIVDLLKSAGAKDSP
jgi:ankyrin repeat protein